MSAKQVIESRIEPIIRIMDEHGNKGKMFRQCFLNTAETTLSQEEDGTAFVITGDIPAMWLRDSTLQVMHYMRFSDDPEVRSLLKGLIEKQAQMIVLDPYANAYNHGNTGAHWTVDRPETSGWVWERKYEIDSLCFPVLLADAYAKLHTREELLTDAMREALRTIYSVFRKEQHHEQSDYWFERDNCPPSDTLCNGGKGTPVAYTGMTWGGFRPSDDACKYGYLIPSELFAVDTLKRIADFADLFDAELAAQARILSGEIERGIYAYGLVEHPNHGLIYAYETDGMGHYNLMDDANVPSLLSLPYLGICKKDDPLYLRTRAFALSDDNRYYYSGFQAKGVGSPHTPPGYVWHIALCIEAMTTDDEAEIARILRTLLTTDAGTEFMHEGFDPNDPSKFTRSWFAWANSMFGELVYSLYEQGKLERILNHLDA
jgi:meiotically up-regulated gene 157 (Mug157) protein